MELTPTSTAVLPTHFALNPPQQQAVTALSRNLLVLAGAGSGKTKVLTERIVYLIQQQGLSAMSILAVTFTNKAANEMRARVQAQLGRSLPSMWIGTFHGLAHRFLRYHWQAAALPEAFQILDSDDQYRLVRRVIRNLSLDEKKWLPKQAQHYINKQKELGLRPSRANRRDFFEQTMAKIYEAYETICHSSGLMDFAELLLRTLEVLQQYPDILAHYQQLFHYILVDEFQDTNDIQYRWLHTLKQPNSYMMAVGDDDQSIYSWRGANVGNIQRFIDDFLAHQTETVDEPNIIRLEQNYRSTESILKAANAVIGHNQQRLGKQLWTQSGQGQPIKLYAAFNERDEADYVINSIRKQINSQSKPEDIAILYRSNAQSRLLEEYLLAAQIPYRIYGGMRFFERAEVKDALAYLRLMANPHDDAAFERVINTPKRGIGQTTLSQLRSLARDQGVSLWQVSETMSQSTSRSSQQLHDFLELIQQMTQSTRGLPLDELTQRVLEQSGLLAFYEKDLTEKGRSRVENLKELVNATSDFATLDTEEQTSPLMTFLAQVVLDVGEAQGEKNPRAVSLMTLHAAKGLEFSSVFMVGLEEELFPHKMCLDDPKALEEERRLCYVGITRAMQQLTVSYARSRHLYGETRYCRASRFIEEIPQECIDDSASRAKVRATHYQSSHQPAVQRAYKKSNKIIQPKEKNSHGLPLGQRVRHPKLGIGTVIDQEGSGASARIQVRFDGLGTKWLVAQYARLEFI